MSRKILVFGASNSIKSINKQLSVWASSQLKNIEPTIIDLNDFEMPIYSIDKERKNGIPEAAQRFRDLINSHDGILVSFAEHNGGFTVAFKNVFDWASRLGKDIWAHKPMFLMATSPGGRGGKGVLESAVSRFKFMGAGDSVHFSLPSFYDNFDSDKGITNDDLLLEFQNELNSFKKLLG